MKKIISAVLCGAMLASVFLSGCNTKPTETETSETETTTEATTEPTETEPELPHIDPDLSKRLVGYYALKLPEDGNMVMVYDDSIRGEFSYSATEERLYFSYSSFRDLSELTLYVEPQTGRFYVNFLLMYGDQRYYGTTEEDSIPLDGLEAFIDAVIERDESQIRLHDYSAWREHEEDIKKDFPVVYSRFMKLSNDALSQLGFGIEELGIPFGDKYRSVDPYQLTSQEIEVKNDCKFVNGVCEDCGKLWTDYFYDAIGKFGYSDENSSWRSLYGQDSSYMFDPSDYVQYSSYGRGDVEIYFQHSIMKDPERNMAGQHGETCRLIIEQNKKKISSSLTFQYEEGMHPISQGIVDFKFRYYMRVEAKDGDYSKIFESKESLMKNSELYLFVKGDNGAGRDVWSTMKDEEIKKMFDEIEFTTYFTKEEFVDMIWNDYQRFFGGMDKGMIWMNTSLADAGIKWKKED